jgi:hypothetical protein
LAAPYQPANGAVVRPAMDDTLTMRPAPRSRMPGNAARARRMGANTMVSMRWWASSSSTSSTAPVSP